jgi:hypothetical protein
MEGKTPSKPSKPRSLADLELPPFLDSPQPHKPRFLDPRVVEAHFAPLMKNPPSAEERWERKANATPFPGV